MTCVELQAEIDRLTAAIGFDERDQQFAVADFQAAFAAVGAANLQLAADQQALQNAQMLLAMNQMMWLC